MTPSDFADASKFRALGAQLFVDAKGIEYYLAREGVFVGYDNSRDGRTKGAKTYWIAHAGLPVDDRTFDNGWEAAAWRDHWREKHPNAVVRWEADVS